MRSLQGRQHKANFIAGKHSWQSCGLFGAYRLDRPGKRLLQDFGIQKQQGAQSLILGCSGNLLVHSEIGEKSLNLGEAKLKGMLLW